MPDSERATVHSSEADVWHLKQITFASRSIKIITQNFNGPCSFIAICNILILRGQLHILPPDRTTVSYEFLAQLVGEYLLTNCPDVDISAALSILPSTTKGLDLNPRFTSVTAFSPQAGELALFSQAGIPLVHGWVVDPASPEAAVMSQIGDYDSAVTLIADADHLTRGRLLGNGGDGDGDDAERRAGYYTYQDEHEDGAGPSRAGSSSAGPSSGQYADEDRRKIEHAIVAHQFLDATKSQLTYHGLFQLASTLAPGSLVALFRNAHLSVVYKSPSPLPDVGTSTGVNANASSSAGAGTSTNPDVTPDTASIPESALYALVTDDVFLHEPSIVWERLEDIDGGWSTFVDSYFHRAVPVGGDVAGQTAEAALRRFEMEAGIYAVVDPADQALARQLQAEEDERAREAYAKRHEALERRRAAEEEARKKMESKKAKRKRIKECVIM